MSFTDDKEQVDDTEASIKWAEKTLKGKLNLPKKSAIDAKLAASPVIDPDSKDIVDDDDVKSTLKSAHQAEWLYGYHGYGPGNFSGG